jgi:hypothetical protein
MVAPIAFPGAAEWLVLSDDLLAGLVHALNNRVTALSVCAELASLGDAEMLTDGVLLTEMTRLQRVSALIGLLPARGHPPEALEIAPMLGDALAIHANHPRLRSIECTVAPEGALQPVRVPRWALLRLLLIFVDAAKGGAQDARRDSVTIRLSSDDRSVRLHAPARETEGAYAGEMASLCGGVLTRHGEELTLTLPSLAEVRRRERMEGAPG